MKPETRIRIAAWSGAALLHLAAGALVLDALSAGTIPSERTANHVGLTLMPIRLQPAATAAARMIDTRTIPVDRPVRTASLQPFVAAAPRDVRPPTPSGGGAAAPAPAIDIAALSGAEASAFRQALLEHIRRYLAYPPEAERERLQGTVELRFVLGRDGHIDGLWVARSSGQPVLDAGALAATQRADPMPAIPADLPDRIELTLPIPYTLG